MDVSSPLLEDPALEAYEGLAPFYDQFTAGQSDRMRNQWSYFRADGGHAVGT